MTPAPLLALADVSVRFGTGGGGHPAVREVSCSLAAGEVLALVGESGSGKTVTALSLLGLLPATAQVSGRALLNGTDLFRLDRDELRGVRGNRIGMVFQEPQSTLNPVFTVGAQLVEAIRVHQRVSRRAARRRAVELLELAGLPGSERRLRAYPHELSGGQLQRVVIAMAIANDPELIIADEPTTALDVTVQAEILELLRDLRGRLGTAILLITHDMGVVADLADRVAVMRDGQLVEEGDTVGLFGAPRHEYTRQLLGAVISLPVPPANSPVPQIEPVLEIDAVSVTYGGRFGSHPVHAVDGVSLYIAPGEVLGLVGESGSGKTTIAGTVTGLVTPSTGVVRIGGVSLTGLRGGAAKRVRRRLGVIFQDPMSSLNPRATVADSIAEPIRVHRALPAAAIADRVNDLLAAVALAPALGTRYPHELSGGQRQRVCIARALALDPDLLIADEPTSALDVSVQARILDLVRQLQRDLRFACLFISHDLAVVHQLATRVAVLHHGRIVEQGPTATVLTTPHHPYTQRLLAAAPVPDPLTQRRRRATHPGRRATHPGGDQGDCVVGGDQQPTSAP